MDNKEFLQLSESEIKEKSKSMATKDPKALSLISIGLAAFVAFYFAKAILIAAVGGLLILLGIGLFSYNITKGVESFKKKFIENYNYQMNKENRERTQSLLNSLTSEEAKSQLTAIQKKKDAFVDKLKKEISVNTYSYQRVLGGFEALYACCMDNLNIIVDYENSVRALQVGKLKSDKADIERKVHKTEHELATLESINKELVRHDRYKDRIKEVLRRNQEAISGMNELQETLIRMKKVQDPEEALEEIKVIQNVLVKREAENAILLD